ncbi:Peptide chain release factor 2 [Clarias magur]|uniref:Peptide chain release factor 2 n=1 Tax=Clarias magur TaxID=1594786 RepID=A0A8J4UWQ6_CLAMG|nr:Peptide chain release factor 2 [Clarias magur]
MENKDGTPHWVLVIAQTYQDTCQYPHESTPRAPSLLGQGRRSASRPRVTYSRRTSGTQHAHQVRGKALAGLVSWQESANRKFLAHSQGPYIITEKLEPVTFASNNWVRRKTHNCTINVKFHLGITDAQHWGDSIGRGFLKAQEKMVENRRRS